MLLMILNIVQYVSFIHLFSVSEWRENQNYPNGFTENLGELNLGKWFHLEMIEMII